MSFVLAATLAVSVCMADHSKPCKMYEVARFGLGEIGKTYCAAMAIQLNDMASELKDGTEQNYYCLPPEESKRL